jgi:hypothetical protein
MLLAPDSYRMVMLRLGKVMPALLPALSLACHPASVTQ